MWGEVCSTSENGEVSFASLSALLCMTATKHLTHSISSTICLACHASAQKARRGDLEPAGRKTKIQPSDFCRKKGKRGDDSDDDDAPAPAPAQEAKGKGKKGKKGKRGDDSDDEAPPPSAQDDDEDGGGKKVSVVRTSNLPDTFAKEGAWCWFRCTLFAVAATERSCGCECPDTRCRVCLGQGGAWEDTVRSTP